MEGRKGTSRLPLGSWPPFGKSACLGGSGSYSLSNRSNTNHRERYSPKFFSSKRLSTGKESNTKLSSSRVIS